jgi:hypothetical protein
MAKADTAAPQMGGTQMKPLLDKATRANPVKVAMGRAKNKTALLSLDRSKGPKILAKTLELEHQDGKDFRWGVAFVDPNPGEDTTVKFRINAKVSGMTKPLIKALKGSGYKNVIFLKDEGEITDPKQDVPLVDEQAGEGEDDDDVTAVAPPPPQGVAPPPPPGPPPSTAPLYDAKELEALLRSLIPQIPGAAGSNTELAAKLKKYAGDANLFIKTNNLKAAAENLKALGDAIDAAKAGSKAPVGGAPVDLAKARTVWQSAQQKITADIDTLRTQLVDTYKAEKLDGEVRQRYDAKVAKLLAAVRADLGEKIDALDGATDPNARKTLVDGAQAIITGYQTALADPVVPDLDTNPFVPLGIQAALKELTGLAAAIH